MQYGNDLPFDVLSNSSLMMWLVMGITGHTRPWNHKENGSRRSRSHAYKDGVELFNITSCKSLLVNTNIARGGGMKI